MFQEVLTTSRLATAEEYYSCNAFLDLALRGSGELLLRAHILYLGSALANVIARGVYFEVTLRVWSRWRTSNPSGVDLVRFVLVTWEFHLGHMCI